MGGGFTHFLMPLVFDGIKSAGSPAFQVGGTVQPLLKVPPGIGQLHRARPAKIGAHKSIWLVPAAE
jgi:hypothetical protein